MGANGSTQANGAGGITRGERERVKRRFERLAGVGGNVTLESFLSAAKLDSIFAYNIFSFIDREGNGTITADDFVVALDKLGRLDNRNDKTKWLFGFYDQDHDDLVSSDDVMSVWKMTSAGSVSQEQLQDTVQALMQEYDLDRDGFLNYTEFERFAHVVMSNNATALSNPACPSPPLTHRLSRLSMQNSPSTAT